MDIIIKPTFKEVLQKGFLSLPYFAHGILEIETHADQDLCLNQMADKEHSGISTGNRWGKGELIMIRGAHACFYKPVIPKFKNLNLSILNTSISQDQANIVFDKFNNLCIDKPMFSWMIEDIKKSPFPNIKFKNGMTWWFRNASQDGKFLEGRSYIYANFDEADLQKDFVKFISDVLSPRLWDFNGALSWTTTPRRGKKNASKVEDDLNNRIKAGDNSLMTFKGDSRKNTFLHPSAHDRMNKLPKRLFNKNVLGLYEDTEGVISRDSLDYCEMISDGIIEKPIPGRKYVNSWDFARSSTFNVGVTIELSDPLQLRGWERKQDNKENRNRNYWTLICQKVKNRHRMWRGKTIIDATGLGDVLDSMLSDINPMALKLHTNIRNEIIETGLSCIELGEIGLPLAQMSHVLNDSFWSAEDELADFDPQNLDSIIWDFVCALFIGIWAAKGHSYGNKKQKKKSPPRINPIAKGRPKYV